MRKATTAIATLALLLGTTLAFTGPAQAASKPKPISTATYLAIAKQVMANDGVPTADQLAAMNTRPDLLDVVPIRVVVDYQMPGYAPDSTEVATAPTSTGSGGLLSVGAEASASTATRSVDRYLAYYAGWPISHKITDYHFVVAWSYNGVNVIGTPSSYSYLKNACGGCQNGGIITNSQYRNYNANGVYAWTVPLTGKWQWCASDCQYFYPQVRFGVYFDGTYHYDVLSKG